MKNVIIMGVGLFIFLFTFQTTIHAETSDEAVLIFEELGGSLETFYRKKPKISSEELEKANHSGGEESASNEQQKQTNDSVENNGQLYEVKTNSVRLRAAPNKNAAVIAMLHNNDKVTVFEESYGWGKTYYDNKEVWIALYLLEEKKESTNKMQEEAGNASTPQKEEETAVKAKENKDIQNKKGEQILANYHFIIDPGHGGKDPGTVGSDIEEKSLTLSTAKKLAEQLRDQGASVTLTRTEDMDISLDKRVQMSNRTDTDVFISIHYNAFEDASVRGIHTFYYGGDENKKLASSVQQSLIKHVNLSDRGAKQADYQVLRDNKNLSLLIELGFISNPAERKIVQTDDYQQEAAKGITTGLEDYFTE